MRIAVLLLAALPLGCRAADLAAGASGGGPRILCVTAHPDDETAFAATLFASTRVLGGLCDLVVITNGEGGFKYSTLAEPLYGLELSREEVGRAHLPAIRRREMLAGAAVLGAREVRFLEQRDHRYTRDVGEVLAPGADVWDLELVRGELARRLATGDYDLVFVLWPSPQTHGHHKAASLLALEAVAALPPERRPAICGVYVSEADEAPDHDPEGLAGHPLTRPARGLEPFVFDRLRPLGYQDRLDWRIPVHWVIAEHKSQGTMQLAMGRGARETFVLFAVSQHRREAVAGWFAELAAARFEVHEYGASAGTNTGAARSVPR